MKKVVVGILIFLASLLLLFGGAIALLDQPRVQTFIIQRVTRSLSEQWGAEVSIERFDFRPFRRLTVEQVYLSDQQRDTLAYIPHLQIDCNLLALANNRLDFTNIRLDRPYIRVRSLSDTTLNCSFLLDLFPADSSAFPLRLNIDALHLYDMRVRYNDILVDQINLDFGLPVLSGDSLDFHIQRLSLRASLGRLDAGFRADIRGDLDSLFADALTLTYRGQQLFDGDLALYHPTVRDSLYVRADCNDLFLNHALLQDLISELQRRPAQLPNPVATLGNVHYRGFVAGRIDRMRLHGVFSSALGSITVNGEAKADTAFNDVNFCGHVSTKRFHLGRLLNNGDLGTVALRAHLDANLLHQKDLDCLADAHIDKIVFKNYPYRNIHFHGTYEDRQITGSLDIDDPNIALNTRGLVDWAEDDTRIDLALHLHHIRPADLNLANRLPQLQIAADNYISIYTAGATPAEIMDNMTGYVIIDSLDIANGPHRLNIEQIKLQIDHQLVSGKPTHQLKIQSDYLTAGITGEFSYNTLPSTVMSFVGQYLPSLRQEPGNIRIKRHTNDLDFYAYFRNLDEITQTLLLPVHLPAYPTIKGYLHESENLFGLQAYVPRLAGDKASMQDITISADNNRNRIALSVYALNHLPQDNPTTAKLGDIKTYLDLTAKDDVIGLSVRLDNTDSVRNEGIIRISTMLQRYAGRPVWDVHIHPTDIVLNDSTWHIADAHVIYTAADRTLAVEHFDLSTGHQSIHADGMASAAPSDSINVRLQNINVNYLLSYTNVAHALSVDGPLTGWATVYGLFSQPMFEAQAAIPQAGLNGVPLGAAFAEAHLDKENKTVVISGDIIDSTAHNIAHVAGLVRPEGFWELDIDCDSVNLAIVNFWTKGILSDLAGLGYGNLHIGGHRRETYITAGLYGKDAQLTVPMIGATFYFSDSVFLDSTAIRFPHITLYDREGHRGEFSGVLSHTQFEDFRYDMTATVDKMLALNLPYDPQAMFYGKVYGSGNVDIRGDEKECRIGVNARTEANSKFYLSVNTASTAANTSFIHFVEPDTTTHDLLKLLRQPDTTPLATARKTSTRVILSLQVEATPAAEINLRMGGDDGLRGRGEGNLKLNYDDRTGDVQLLGTYTLNSGTFTFSLGNIVRRSFDIADGSRVIWSGDPTAPTVDVIGKYHLTASLRDLYGSEIEQLATNRTSVPVNCVLHMTDELFNPVISFAIELPQSDESVQSQVRSLINTNEMLMRQVIYLLVFNRFYTPDYLQNTRNVGLNETYSLLSSTITGQINAWLSKLTDIFTMGFNIRTDGEGANASQEYEANFQLHPINQLLINGNFGYRYNDLSNRPFFGDLDIEYILTEDGKLRAKAYTHTVDKYSLRQANTVQGVGFVFKHDFNWTPRRRKDSAEVVAPNDTVSTPDTRTTE